MNDLIGYFLVDQHRAVLVRMVCNNDLLCIDKQGIIHVIPLAKLDGMFIGYDFSDFEDAEKKRDELRANYKSKLNTRLIWPIPHIPQISEEDVEKAIRKFETGSLKEACIIRESLEANGVILKNTSDGTGLGWYRV